MIDSSGITGKKRDISELEQGEEILDSNASKGQQAHNSSGENPSPEHPSPEHSQGSSNPEVDSSRVNFILVRSAVMNIDGVDIVKFYINSQQRSDTGIKGG